VPSRKELQWSELKVGMLVLVAIAVLIGLIFLMSGSSGGLFAHKLVLRSYFENAAGLKVGAPVTLEGVTIGNVTHIRVVPDREPSPVEVRMRVGEEFMDGLHATSTASIAQAGVLGDSYVDISSQGASGPPPGNNAELKATGSPSIQDVIRTSKVSIEDLTRLMGKVEILIDSLNSGKGTMGQLIKNPELFNRISQLTEDLHVTMTAIASGQGTIGKLVKDDTLYTRLNSTIDHLDHIAGGLDEGKGTAGKLLKNEELYTNLNVAVKNVNELLVNINAGHGTIGKLSHDPEFARKFDDAVTHLDSVLKSVDEGKGTIGQLFVNKSLYDHLDETTDQATKLLTAIRQDPKKYFVIRLKLF
jgi:phospholipid/cholesterol/gamma-HCH transport system substrate-binding protein